MGPNYLTWPDAVVLAVAKYGGSAHLNRICDDAPRIYGKRPATSEQLISATLQANSSDSQTFSERDLFFSVAGIGGGQWGIRDAKDRALGELMSELGMNYLALQVRLAHPSTAQAGKHLIDRVKQVNVVEFAQNVLPTLPFWQNAK